jgi:bifunctional non-homologous end joining protein LigD
MLASTGVLPHGAGWSYEFKWDGVRAVAHIDNGKIRLYARSGAEITAAYPELRELGAAVRSAVLDGEIVVLDGAGRPSFVELAERMHVRDPHRAAALAATKPVTLMIFDLLALYGADLFQRPYQERRSSLETLDLNGPHWLTPPTFADGEATLAAARENQLEGVMAKRTGSLYRPGARTADWVKVKIDMTAEFVVGGWRPGSRALGALFIGLPAEHGLLYCGRVGGGISGATEKALLAALTPLAVPDSPFATPVPRLEAKDAVWTRPELVVEVVYGQLLPDGKLRFPRFLRLRPDLTPEDLHA